MTAPLGRFVVKVVTFSDFGAPDVLVVEERPQPRPRSDDVLVSVHVAGVNRADVLQRQGRYPPPAGAPDWPGLEVSGTVAECGANVRRFSPGDRVAALLPGGGYAVYATAPEAHVLPIPEGMTDAQAASAIEAACTVQTVLDCASPQPGEPLLIHGGSGGIGTAAIQIAVGLGLTVIATARGDRTEVCSILGADVTVDYTAEDFVSVVNAAGGADVILDVVGAGYLERNVTALREGGRLVVIGLQQGATGNVDLAALLSKRASIYGTTLRSRSDGAKAKVVQSVEATIWPMLGSAFVPVVHASFPFSEASSAHRALENGEARGNVVLVP